METITRFIFEKINTRFGFSKILMRNYGASFLNDTICAITREFMIHNKKCIPYHPQANGIVKSFDKKLEHGLTKVCNV
jgi:hypothetical protein